MLEAYKISNYLQLAGSVAVAIICLLSFGKRPQYIKMLGFYAVAGVSFSLLQQASVLFFSNAGVNAIANGYVLSETIFISLLFYCATSNAKFKRGIFILSSLYTVFYIITLLTLDTNSLSFIRIGRDSLLIVYALAFFYYLIRKLPEENLLKFPLFWINSSIIFFFSGTFILSLMVNYIVSVLNTDLASFWTFRNIFKFLYCLVLTYAGWLDWRTIRINRA